MYCCFTGHRPEHLPWLYHEDDPRCKKLKKVLYNTVEQAIIDGYKNFYCGMARGIDTLCAETVLELSVKFPDVKLHAVLPCPGQSDNWLENDRAVYKGLLEKCSSKVLVSPFYTDTCMLARNRYMVDNSERLIAVWNGYFRGGSAYTVRYAKKQSKEIHLIRTADLSISIL